MTMVGLLYAGRVLSARRRNFKNDLVVRTKGYGLEGGRVANLYF